MEIQRRNELLRHLPRALDPALREGRVTACVGANDSFAVVCREALTRRGVRVPTDVSLVGFDDTEESSLCKINSYNFNYAGLTAAMVGFVVGSAVSGQVRARGVVTLDGCVVERGSVRTMRDG